MAPDSNVPTNLAFCGSSTNVLKKDSVIPSNPPLPGLVFAASRKDESNGVLRLFHAFLHLVTVSLPPPPKKLLVFSAPALSTKLF